MKDQDAPKKQLEPSTEPSTPETPSEGTPQKETPTTPKTGDDYNPLIWLLLLGLGGCLLGAGLYLRKKGNQGQHRD